MKTACIWLPNDTDAISVTIVRGREDTLTLENKMFSRESIDCGTLNALNEQEADHA